MYYMPQILNCGFYDSMPNRPNQKKSEPRNVNHFELELFISDSGISVVNDIKYPLKNGCLLFSKPGDIRYSYLHFKAYFVHFAVDDPTLKSELMQLPTFLHTSKNNQIKECFMKIIHSFFSSSLLENFSANAQLIPLLSFINNLEENHSYNTDILSKARKFIEQNYSENITVKTIAEHCNISETHLYRIFKNSLSTTPNDYLLDIRISAARKLLCNTNLSICEITFACGFNSQSYFADCFKRKNSISPSKFKKLHKYPS